MGKLFYLMGKSSTGKDTIKETLLADPSLGLTLAVPYTTRPIRDGEQEGREYHFITDARANALQEAGKIVEMRVYQTVYGPWKYMFVDEGIDLSQADYLAVGTVEAYLKVREHFGNDLVEPLYIYVEDGVRLQRALDRERQHKNPKYAEMCRRFLADEADFDEAHLREAGLLGDDGERKHSFENMDFDACVQAIKERISHGRE